MLCAVRLFVRSFIRPSLEMSGETERGKKEKEETKRLRCTYETEKNLNISQQAEHCYERSRAT